MKSYKRLTSKQDLLMLMDFRQLFYKEWVEYTHSEGYESKVRGDL